MNTFEGETVGMSKKQYIIEYNRRFISELDNRSFNPLVSIIICNRNGLDNLVNLFDSFKNHTFYSNYELIIIDNASVDESIIFIDEQKVNYSIKLIRNKKNETFSRACNQGAEIANGDYLLFLNNDIEVTDFWLDELLKIAQNQDQQRVGAIGAKLVYPEIPENTINFGKDYKIQHAGIAFHRTTYENCQYIRPYNKGNGKEPFAENEKVCDISAVTAACLLIKKDVFNDIGGFDENYIYGYEDVDLCLKALRKGYTNLYCPTAVLFHYEFGTQQNDIKEEVYLRRKRNLLYFTRRWSDFLKKRILDDKINKKNLFSENCLTIAFIMEDNGNTTETNNSILDFGKALENIGYVVKYLKRENTEDWYDIGYDTDVVINTTCEYDISKIKKSGSDIITIAWIKDDLQEWCDSLSFQYYTFVFTESKNDYEKIFFYGKRVSYLFNRKPSQLIDLIKTCYYQFEQKLAILIPVRKRKDAEWWGDYHFAKALKRCFEKRCFDVEIRFFSEWDLPFDGKYILVLRGLEKYIPKMIHFNIMWNISHPDSIDFEEYDLYDVNFISSNIWAEHLKNLVKMPVFPLLQCTDTEVFTGEKDNSIEKTEILFVGNTRHVFRDVIKNILPTDYKLAVFGRGWGSFIDSKYIKGTVILNRKLNYYYSNCDILLNDHWADMKEKGFISNRIFDGLAAGAFVISDEVKGMDEEIMECVVMYKDRADLREKIAYYMNQPLLRNNIASKGQEIVRKKHTFQNRTDKIIDYLNSCKKEQRSYYCGENFSNS